MQACRTALAPGGAPRRAPRAAAPQAGRTNLVGHVSALVPSERELREGGGQRGAGRQRDARRLQLQAAQRREAGPRGQQVEAGAGAQAHLAQPAQGLGPAVGHVVVAVHDAQALQGGAGGGAAAGSGGGGSGRVRNGDAGEWRQRGRPRLAPAWRAASSMCLL